MRGWTGPSSGPQSVVTRDDDQRDLIICHVPLQMPSHPLLPQAGRLSCVYENSPEKSTLYKHSGPLDLSMILAAVPMYPTVLTGLGLISLFC